jgi:hypothetical protein
MLITEREAEEICIALMKMKTPEGLQTLRGGRLAMSIMKDVIEKGRFTFEVEKGEK